MRVYNQYNNIRNDEGERFALPSLTDQMADEPLERIVNRFLATNGTLPMMSGTEVPEDEEKLEEVFEQLASADVSQLTRVEQAEVLLTAQRLVEQLESSRRASRKEERKSDVESVAQKTSSNDSLKEGKLETEAKNG